MAGRALLLAGAPGTGKTALALGIAQVCFHFGVYWFDITFETKTSSLLNHQYY